MTKGICWHQNSAQGAFRPCPGAPSLAYTFQTSSLKPLSRLKPNCIWSLHGSRERKFAHMVCFTPLRWPPCPYLIKRTCIFFLLRNQWASGHGTWYVEWYVASGTWAYLNKLTWWPWFDHDLLYDKVKFGPLCFSMGKNKIIGLFKN